MAMSITVPTDALIVAFDGVMSSLLRRPHSHPALSGRRVAISCGLSITITGRTLDFPSIVRFRFES